MTLHPQCEEPCAASPPPDLLDLPAVCRFFGGNEPLHPATIYRGCAAGRYPPPIKVGPNTSRWLLSECKAALAALIAGRAAK
ncbi:putative DNA-binding transcriptional regulator AlpA [Bradyrhizobium embrapense]